MKRAVCVFLCLILLTACGSNELLENRVTKPEESMTYETTMKQDLLCMLMGYPEFITGVEKEESGLVYLIMKSGQRVLYDDKREKNSAQKISQPDVQDMLEQPYPLESITTLMDEDFDPGRLRVYPILKEVYGGSRGAIEKNLMNVRVGSRNYAFNRRNRAAESLKAVMAELNILMKNNPSMYAYVLPASGSYNYRVISGTNRLSPHAFGTAIDLKSDKRDYWKWATREQGEARIASYPEALVKVFEKHHFVWGGKWGHFDILHFEYRPELIYKAKYFSGKEKMGGPWDEGLPSNDVRLSGYIQMIERALK